jgi:hypothetical protein
LLLLSKDRPLSLCFVCWEKIESGREENRRGEIEAEETRSKE